MEGIASVDESAITGESDLPGQRADLEPAADWDLSARSLTDLARRLL